jgi:hypothetical protein
MGFELFGSSAEDGPDAAGLPSQSPGGGSHLDRALSKVGRRIIPLTMAIAISNHMDRSK